MYILRAGILSFNVAQEAEQYLGVIVEKNNLKPKVLSYILPGPELTVHISESMVEEEGGDSIREK